MHTLLVYDAKRYGDICMHTHFDQVQIHKEIIESGSRRRAGADMLTPLWFNSWGVGCCGRARVRTPRPPRGLVLSCLGGLCPSLSLTPSHKYPPSSSDEVTLEDLQPHGTMSQQGRSSAVFIGCGRRERILDT